VLVEVPGAAPGQSRDMDMEMEGMGLNRNEREREGYGRLDEDWDDENVSCLGNNEVKADEVGYFES
jgi:hypothetical protein